ERRAVPRGQHAGTGRPQTGHETDLDQTASEEMSAIRYVSDTSFREASTVTISSLAGKPAPKELLVDVAHLEREYFSRRPDITDSNQRVRFGTSGHRGSP